MMEWLATRTAPEELTAPEVSWSVRNRVSLSCEWLKPAAKEKWVLTRAAIEVYLFLAQEVLTRAAMEVYLFLTQEVLTRAAIEACLFLTKATVGGVFPFSLVCLSHSHE